jgi:nicotinamidase-related amidase
VSKALLVIDVQNDYFPGGSYPLWNAEQTLDKVEQAIQKARADGTAVIVIQHVANAEPGKAPFFNAGTKGVELHPRIVAAADGAPVVVKQFADSFERTTLEEVLSKLGVTELLVSGMMTQNCVTHTAISKAAEKYDVTVLVDCCTTADPMVHGLALNALSTRVRLRPSTDVS